MNDDEYNTLKKKFYQITGLDLDSYKKQQMRRRLTAYVEHHASGVAEYCRHLESSRAAVDTLRNYIAINVSEFFRDSRQFDVLAAEILPRLLKRSPRLNVWSAGCSHGEEPFSLAMLLDQLAPDCQHRIVATDIDSDALRIARAGGPYVPEAVKGVPRNLLAEYFIRGAEGSYMLTNLLRQRVTFKEHNLLQDAFEQGFDLIMCRNVVIYFTEETKNTLYSRFHRSLKPGGVFFTGGAEVILAANKLDFSTLKAGFYQKPELTPSPGEYRVPVAV